jgi:hypothetical protein
VNFNKIGFYMKKKTYRANPMLTKTGKRRLGPLNMKQLTEFLASSSKPKDKARIRNRIAIMEKRQVTV